MEIALKDTSVEITIKHLEFTSLIGRSWIDPSNFMKIFVTSGDPANILVENVAKKGGFDGRITYFAKWSQIEFFPSLHEHERFLQHSQMADLELLNRKILVHHQILPPRNTSQLRECYFVDYDTKKPLAFSSILGVSIDPTTHQPTPFPKCLKEYFTPERCVPPVKLENVAPPSCQKLYDIPDHVITFTMTSEVTFQQIDENNHVAAPEYFNFCIDCVGAAFLKSTFGQFGSVFNYKLKRMSLLYIGEVVLGESVKIICWQDGQNPFAFKFHIMNPKGVVCQAEFEFFPHESLKMKP